MQCLLCTLLCDPFRRYIWKVKDRHSHRIQLDSNNTYHHVTMVRQCPLIVICVLFTLCLPKRLRSFYYIYLFISADIVQNIICIPLTRNRRHATVYLYVSCKWWSGWLYSWKGRYVCKDKIITHWDISSVIGMIEWSFPFVCCLVLKTSNSINSSAAGWWWSATTDPQDSKQTMAQTPKYVALRSQKI